MNDKLILSPKVVVRLNTGKGKTDLLVENLDTKKSILIDSELVWFVDYICEARNKKELINYLQSEFKKFPASNVVSEFKKRKILITYSEFKEFTKNFKKWHQYNWWFPLQYFLSTQDIETGDRKSSDQQSAILKNYLKKRKEEITFYKQFPKDNKKILGSKKFPDWNLRRLLMMRRTSRDFSRPMKESELGTILSESSKELVELRELQSKKYKENPQVLLRSTFCAFEIYLSINNVSGIDRGLYHYDVKENALDPIRRGDFRKTIVKLAQGQEFLFNASCIVLISAVFERFIFRYRQPRAYRDLLTSTAELAQLIILSSTGMGIKTFETPAIKDSETCKLFGLDGWSEDFLYLISLGK